VPRAFVTGATGQDGSYLVERLIDNGWEVHALVRSSMTDGETAVPDGVHAHVGDLSDRAALAGLVDETEPDLVVNLGGITSVARSWQEPSLTGLISGVAAVALMEAALRVQERRGAEVRFVQASSAEIFGAATQIPQNESTPLRPVSPYGAAKSYAHESAAFLRGQGLAVSCAVLYNHESPRRPTGFVTRKITAGVARISRGLERELVLGNLDARRDWGWAPDYVDAMLRMTTADPDDFIVATGIAHSVRDFVAAAFAAAGIEEWEPLVRVDPAFLRPDDAPLQIGDASRARERLGWSPTIAFEGIVAAMVHADLDDLDRRS
jgi:GDPmannose 4,6-dehydratase